jgi:hypothetical protein
MKIQIKALSPHQNAKVMAVLMAVSSLIFLVPFAIFAFASTPPDSQPPLWWFVSMPIFYLLFGYIAILVGCWLYNVMFRYVGGLEFTSAGSGADAA